jgi:tetratricopeptide (TPR) repeat protein
MKLQKDGESAEPTLHLRNAIWARPYLAVMGLIWGYLAGGSSGAVVGLAGAFLASATIGSAGLIRKGLLGKGTVSAHTASGLKTIGQRKRPASDLNRVRYHKLCNRFDQALLALEEVLAKDPDFPEALILKAQILWEGFDDREGARSSLLRLMKVEPDEKAVFRRWAVNFYRELSETGESGRWSTII